MRFSNSSTGYSIDGTEITYNGGSNTWDGEIHPITDCGFNDGLIDPSEATTVWTVGTSAYFDRIWAQLDPDGYLGTNASGARIRAAMYYFGLDSLVNTDDVTAAQFFFKTDDTYTIGNYDTGDTLLCIGPNVANFADWPGGTGLCYDYVVNTDTWGTALATYGEDWWDFSPARVETLVATGADTPTDTWLWHMVTPFVEAWVEDEDTNGGFWLYGDNDQGAIGDTYGLWSHEAGTGATPAGDAGDRPYLMIWIER